MGHPEWATDDKYARSRDRLANRVDLSRDMTEALSQHGKQHWMKVINAAKVSCGPINDMPDIERDEQLLDRDMFVTLSHEQMGDVRVVGSPLKFSATPVVYNCPPPLAGEHTEELLRERLTLSDEQIEDLRARKII